MREKLPQDEVLPQIVQHLVLGQLLPHPMNGLGMQFFLLTGGGIFLDHRASSFREYMNKCSSIIAS